MKIYNKIYLIKEDGHPFSKYGHQPSPGWSITIPRRVTHHPKVCHPPPQGRPPTIIRMVTYWPNDMVEHHPRSGHPKTVEWSPIISMMVN